MDSYLELPRKANTCIPSANPSLSCKKHLPSAFPFPYWTNCHIKGFAGYIKLCSTLPIIEAILRIVRYGIVITVNRYVVVLAKCRRH